MELGFIVETRVRSAPGSAPLPRPNTVRAGESFVLELAITSDDGDAPAVDTPILVAFHLCAWNRKNTDRDAPGLAGFASPDLAIGEHWSDALPLTLKGGDLTTELQVTFTPPLLGARTQAILHARFYLAENGALIGHAARAITIVSTRFRGNTATGLPVDWPDEDTEDDLRKGIGWLVLPDEPLPHPTLVLYATSYGGDLALAVSVYERDATGQATLRLHDLGRMRDPEAIGCLEGPGSSFSLAAYLNSAGEAIFGDASDWTPPLALRATNCLRAMLPPVCQRFLTDQLAPYAGRDGAAPTLLVSTDDLLFPWELVRVTADGAATPRTLGQVAAVSRWLHHKPLPGHVHVERAAFLAPESSTIAPSDQEDRDKLANQEADVVRAFLGGDGSGFCRIEPSTIPAAITALDRTEYQLIHMRSHGTKYGVQLAAADGKYERAVFSLRPRHLPGWDAERALNRPFVVINVCGGAFSESERWLEALHSYGVGAAVVTLWNVASDLSEVVATRLYHALAAGQSVAEALRSVRALHAFAEHVVPSAPTDPDPGYPDALRRNPTALGYIVLGHPCARVIPG